MRGLFKTVGVFAACVTWVTAPPCAGEDEGLPGGFRFVGNYQVVKRVKVRDGEVVPVAMRPLLLRVYTDGIEVRVYGNLEREDSTVFKVYRDDGVMVEGDEDTVETIPGVQARTLVGGVLRQMTLTNEGLVLAKFPAFSDIVELSYANRIISIRPGQSELTGTR